MTEWRSIGRLVLGLVAFTTLGCASNPETLEAPPGTSPPVETAPAPGPEESEGAAPTADEPDHEGDDFTVVIDPGKAEASPTMTLLEAAAAERERRRTAPPPSIVITNENLAEHATGELTVVSSGARTGGAKESTQADPGAGAPGPEGGEPASEVLGEAYWRDRVLQVRSDWRQTVEEVAHLEERVAELRRRFYAEDDPYYRDTQIKPSWDRTLERLEEARKAADGFRARLDQVLEEGRQAGALPGWLREGLELEPVLPDDEGEQRVPEHQPQEPTVIDGGGVDAP